MIGYRSKTLPTALAALLAVLTGCSGVDSGTPQAVAPAPAGPAATPTPSPAPGGSGTAGVETTRPFTVTAMERFNEPWALAALPDGRLLVTEKSGALKIVRPGESVGDIAGVPPVVYGGQGGLGDVVLHPEYTRNGRIYLSYAEAGNAGLSGAAVARATLRLDAAGGGSLSDLVVVWRQLPKVTGQGHYGHRIAFGPDGHLWISSGDRQKGEPAQDLQSALGKLVRLNEDGTVPADNPFVAQGGTAAQVWSLGHRNPLGFAFDAQGQPWFAEMGPRGGDEFNRLQREANYGWPRVSDGDNYDGTPIPDHATQPQYAAPVLTWTPAISPGSMIFYSGGEFPAWRGSALLAGLSSQALIRVAFEGSVVREAGRYAMGARIREVEQAPDGTVWLLEDGPQGRLLQLRAPR